LSKPCFYLDENVQSDVQEQLQGFGIEVVSARTLDTLGDTDEEHLQRAIAMNYVFCTFDQDFFSLALLYPHHAGIVWATSANVGIGDWVTGLSDYHAKYAAEEMRGLIWYLSAR
jgi:predicted nuclease of predicted toxin-antitoxin system